MPLTEIQVRMLEDKRKLASKVPQFVPERQTWRNWRQAFKTCMDMMGMSSLGETGQPREFIDFTKYVTASAMQGTAVERIRPFLPGTDSANRAETLAQYLDLLESVFQPPQESRSLKLEFKSRKQGIGEDVSCYLSSKLSLYDVAYGQNQQDFETLLTEVIGGLYSNVIKRRLRNADDVTDRNTLRTKLFDIVAKEKEQYLAGYAESTSLDGLTAVAVPMLKQNPVPGWASRTGEEPMEIDMVGEKVCKVDQSGKPKLEEKRTCYNCRQVGHLRRDCPKTSKKERKDKDNKKEVRCVHCNKKGHTVEACFKRKADKAEARKKHKIQEMGKSKETPKEENSDSETETMSFLGTRGGPVILH